MCFQKLLFNYQVSLDFAAFPNVFIIHNCTEPDEKKRRKEEDEKKEKNKERERKQWESKS